MMCSVKNTIICIVEHGTLSLHSISSRRIICIFDARSISCFCGYLKDDNWLRGSDPFARSLQYIPRYTSRTVFRRVIVIFHRNLIFVKKSDRMRLVAVGRSVHVPRQVFLIPAFYSIYLVNYNRIFFCEQCNFLHFICRKKL